MTTSPGGRGGLQPRGKVDGVPDHREAALQVGADVPDHRRAGADRDPEPWPAGMIGGQAIGLRADGQGRPGGAHGVVGLLGHRVEDHDDRVTSEPVDQAALLEDRRHGRRPVPVQHLDHLTGGPVLREAREPGQVSEEHTHLALLPAQPGPLRLARHARRQLRGHVEVEQRIHPAELPCRSLEHVGFLAAHSFLAQARQDLVDRSSGPDRIDDCREPLSLVPVDPPQGPVEVDAGEHGRERSLPPILQPGRDEDRAERHGHEHMPLPPHGVPGSREAGGEEQPHPCRDREPCGRVVE